MSRFFSFLINLVLTLTGIGIAGLGLKGFLLPNYFIDGGVTGISMLIAEVAGIPLSVLIVLLNIPFLLVGYKSTGKAFAARSALAILGLAAALHLVPYSVVTSDKLLAAVFGGFFLGAGIGLAVRGGAVLDGTEILALLISKKTSFSMGDIILVFNIVIFSVAAVVMSIETALYSILTYLSAAKTVDFVIHGLEEQSGVTIISQQHERIREAVLHDLQRGVTVYKGRGGFSGEEAEILFCIVTRLEIGKLKTLVQSIDPSAFVVIHHISDTSGGVVKRL
jgi:uncharacterized membrane-anchored protein YitT (DUF2179 family)